MAVPRNALDARDVSRIPDARIKAVGVWKLKSQVTHSNATFEHSANISRSGSRLNIENPHLWGKGQVTRRGTGRIAKRVEAAVSWLSTWVLGGTSGQRVANLQ